jgi:hypothetical protein
MVLVGRCNHCKIKLVWADNYNQCPNCGAYTFISEYTDFRGDCSRQEYLFNFIHSEIEAHVGINVKITTVGEYYAIAPKKGDEFNEAKMNDAFLLMKEILIDLGGGNNVIFLKDFVSKKQINKQKQGKD